MNLKNKETFKYVRRSLRNNSTGAERILWEFLRRENLGVKFRRQYSFGNYVMDFYCPEIKLGIEIDGSIHDSQQEADEYRTRTLNSYGIQVIRFKNSEIFNDLDSSIEKLKIKIYPLSPSLIRRDV